MPLVTYAMRRVIGCHSFGVGEWGIGNGEWGMGNGEWGIGKAGATVASSIFSNWKLRIEMRAQHCSTDSPLPIPHSRRRSTR
ncbi:hypothetical protein E2P62_18170 [Xanthomonas perforans]|nr:hypothetical protein E2P62_18170 [Xanthomonas perforans]